jgi:hypothetical protein
MKQSSLLHIPQQVRLPISPPGHINYFYRLTNERLIEVLRAFVCEEYNTHS